MYQGIQCYPEFLIYYERVADEMDADTWLPVDHAGNENAESTDQHVVSLERQKKFKVLRRPTDHSRESAAIVGEDDDTEAAPSELEILERDVENLKRRAVEQTDRRVVLLASQKRLKMRLQHAKAICLEFQSRSAKARRRCCGRYQGPDVHNQDRRTNKYLQLESSKAALQ